MKQRLYHLLVWAGLLTVASLCVVSICVIVDAAIHIGALVLEAWES